MTPMALVVERDTKTLQLIDDVLTALDHEYQPVASLVDARKVLRTNVYAYILLSCEIPSRPHDTPRIQNAENFLEALRRFQGNDMPPVIVLLPPQGAYPDMTREESIRMAHGLMLRGATDFIAKPFATAGRTLDRVIKKVLNGRCAPADSEKPKALSRLPLAPTSQGGDVQEGEAIATDQAVKPAPDAGHENAGALTKGQMDVLEALGESPHQTVLQAEIIEGGGYSKHATHDCLGALQKLGLVHRPRGQRGGYAITETGRALLTKTAGKVSATNDASQ